MSTVDITLPGFNIMYDVRGNTSGIVMSLAGNQWFVIDELTRYLNNRGFEVYIETIPPGLVKERAMGRALRVGDLVINLRPEIVSLPPQMLSGLNIVESFDYVENELAIVYTNKAVNDWCDLSKVRAAIPNPVTEGIGALFRDLYNEYCGDYLNLVSKGSIYITKIHHREIPELLNHGIIDAGVVWTTEAKYWRFNYVTPKVNKVGRLAFALMPWASEKAKELFKELQSNEVKKIYEKYGFKWVGKT
jgi:hypothetical protein